MTATIYFLYDPEHEGYTTRRTTIERAEQDIRYWLTKSPGIHPIADILVVLDCEKKSWMWIIERMAMEQSEYGMRLQEQEERQTYERLKAKYGT